MGYYAHTKEVDFRIKKENLDAAYKAACDLNWRNELKSGGTFGSGRPNPLPDGPNEWCWFGWVAWNYHETCKDLPAVLEEFGYESEIDAGTGDLVNLWYSDSKISGGEESLMLALSPFVEEGSYIEWGGEDETFWKWEFRDKTMDTLEGSITWHRVVEY